MPESKITTPTNELPQPVKSDSKATLRRIMSAVAIGAVIAAAQSVAAALPEVANATLAVVPYGALLAPYVAKGALFLQSYILIKAATYHKGAVDEAMNTPVPPGQEKYY